MLTDFEGNFTQDHFLPEEIKGTKFYEPGINPKGRGDQKEA